MSPNGRYPQLAEEFELEGVVLVRRALDDATMARLDAMFADHLAATDAFNVFAGDGGTVLQSSSRLKKRAGARSANDAERLEAAYIDVLENSLIADIVRTAFRGHDTFYFGTQLWFKETAPGGEGTPRSTWHQDTAYFPIDGLSFANVWIPLDHLDARNVLEVVRKSHRGALYNATGFDPDNLLLGLYDDERFPPFPDIEADRDGWDIYAEEMRRGDILLFHPGCLHGGAPTFAGQRRRTLSFRLFADSVIYAPRPEIRKDNEHARRREENGDVQNDYRGISAGEAFYKSGDYPRVRPSIKGLAAP